MKETTMPPKNSPKALKPKQGGYDALKERQKRAKQTFRVSVLESDLTFVYRPFSIPTTVRAFVRDATGMSLDEFLYQRGAIDVSTYVDLWWISRLCDGEVGANGKPISRVAVQAEFDERVPGCTLADIEDHEVNGDEVDSPEA